ncbi:MAG: hypothetical protein WAT51_07270 [Holophaga sp.]
MRLSRRAWWGLVLAIPILSSVALGLVLGVGLRDLKAAGRRLVYRQAPAATLWQAPEADGDLADFTVTDAGQLLALREGGLWTSKEGTLQPLGAPQGILHLFPEAKGGWVWVAASYHRVLAWEAGAGLRHVLSVRGAVRGVQRRGDRLVVGFEEAALGRGQLMLFRRQAGAWFEPDGLEISVGMDRWSGFDLSPDGTKLLANLPTGKGVGIWSTEDGRLLASWPGERLARVLCFVDDQRVLFDQGPASKIRDGAYAQAANRVVQAQVEASGALSVIADHFAAVLSSDHGPNHLAFADMEGLVRVIELEGTPRLVSTFSPKGRGIPWQVRFTQQGLWVFLKGDTNRIERYGCE